MPVLGTETTLTPHLLLVNKYLRLIRRGVLLSKQPWESPSYTMLAVTKVLNERTLLSIGGKAWFNAFKYGWHWDNNLQIVLKTRLMEVESCDDDNVTIVLFQLRVMGLVSSVALWMDQCGRTKGHKLSDIVVTIMPLCFSFSMLYDEYYKPRQST